MNEFKENESIRSDVDCSGTKNKSEEVVTLAAGPSHPRIVVSTGQHVILSLEEQTPPSKWCPCLSPH